MKKTAYIFLLALSFAACKSTQNAVSKNKPATREEMNAENSAKQMQQNGDDFFANGNTPVNWSLQMDFDNKTAFTADDGIAVSFATNYLKKTEAAGKTTYTGKISAGDITIITEDGDCTVSTIRKVYKKLISVTIAGKTYTGCGSFLLDSNLGGKWILEKIGTSPIAAADYNKVPIFSFDLTTMRLSGNDGCNSIGSAIEVQGSRIKFSGVMSTRMACTKKSIEAVISKSISNKVADYYFKEGKLYLYLIDDSLLVFTKG